jgi:hypothetical protein
VGPEAESWPGRRRASSRLHPQAPRVPASGRLRVGGSSSACVPVLAGVGRPAGARGVTGGLKKAAGRCFLRNLFVRLAACDMPAAAGTADRLRQDSCLSWPANATPAASTNRCSLLFASVCPRAAALTGAGRTARFQNGARDGGSHRGRAQTPFARIPRGEDGAVAAQARTILCAVQPLYPAPQPYA